jgi:hypothetical protein
MAEVGARRNTRGADRPSSLAGHDRAQVHSTNRGRVCPDHRPDPRSRAAQTTARDPPQPARPAPGRCAESRNRRRRHDAAVPSARLRRVALGTFVCRRLLAGPGGMLDALDRLPGPRGGPDAVRISAAVRARLGERGRPGSSVLCVPRVKPDTDNQIDTHDHTDQPRIDKSHTSDRGDLRRLRRAPRACVRRRTR